MKTKFHSLRLVAGCLCSGAIFVGSIVTSEAVTVPSSGTTVLLNPDYHFTRFFDEQFDPAPWPVRVQHHPQWKHRPVSVSDRLQPQTRSEAGVGWPKSDLLFTISLPV